MNETGRREVNEAMDAADDAIRQAETIRKDWKLCDKSNKRRKKDGDQIGRC